ncbi:LamG-like jellyroll fold domain-containing protein [Streptomyces sp900129855]|uniref:exo-alpha-sialidase n=1 Tax=Streptomyces sp. 900129855 TaxID=3155129 RepID=A0ABV2ZB01_9ACTN
MPDQRSFTSRRRRRRTLAVALLSMASLLAAPTANASGTRTSDDRLVGTQQTLYRSGTGGYGCFRIPSLIRTKAGTLLAFAEGRHAPSCADRGPIDIVVRRSTDDGRTWGPIRTVLSGSDTDPEAPYTRDNATPVADDTTGDVFLVSTGEPVTRGTRLPYVQKSIDDGLTFGAPRALTRLSGKTSGWFATGPAHGIQLHNGPYAGRLVVGAYESPNATTQLSGVLYSSDHGTTWQSSTTQNSYVAGELKPTETAVAELDNGDVYLAARNELDDTKPHRTHAISTDGGATVGRHTVANLTTPQIQASVLALRHTYQDHPGDTLVLAAPSGSTAREKLRIRYSTDRGTTWTDAPDGQLNADRAGYSDLAELTGGELGLVYEGGTDFSAANIYFNRFTPTAIGLPGTFDGTILPQPTPDAGPTTPDSTPDANDAHLTGTTAAVSGRFRQALSFPAPGGHADIPYSPTIDPGSGDVTYSLLFNHQATATTPQRALLWAYGHDSTAPQLWIRAIPKDNQIVAWAEGSGSRVTLTLQAPDGSAAYGDGAWHHLTLVRSGDRVSLGVDGTTVTRTGLTGSLTAPRAAGVEGIRLGAKPDATASDTFTGALDEFRLYRTALTDAQLTELRTKNTATQAESALAAHLPFQTVDTATDPTLTTVPVEDDISANCADATLLLASGATPRVTTAARMGLGALPVAPDRPGLEVPYVPALDTADGDFTLTLWFRYTATPTTPNAALLWAYGSTTGQPSLWIRARPQDDQLYAWAETDHGKVNFALPDPDTTRTAFGDDQWHLLTATRAGTTFTLSVDHTHTQQADGLTGSFTAGRTTVPGLRLGSRPGGTEILTGTLDDFRLYDRALTDAELTKIAAPASGTGAYPAGSRIWWSMENGTTQAHDVMRPTAGPATPDASTHCDHAYVRGNPGLSPGRFGNGIDLDGADDSVELPYTASKALGAGDFTLATWLRYDATTATGTPVLAWAYGQGATERQLWLRAEPGSQRLAALVQTENAATTAYAPDTDFRTGTAWHHVVLQRKGTQLTLSVDGTPGTPGTIPAGSVTYGDAFDVTGIHLGARPDGAATTRLAGSLDEFRLIRRALTTDELTALRETNTDPTDRATVVHLAFEKVTTQGYARM